MPIEEHSPLGAKWTTIDKSTGELIHLVLKPDHILGMIAQGFTPEEIAKALDMADVGPIDHCIAEIPLMMAWRRQEAARRQQEQGETKGPDRVKKLPTFPGS